MNVKGETMNIFYGTSIKYTAGKISIEHVNISLKKHISNQAIDMKFSPDVGINPSNAHIQRIQTFMFIN